MFGILFYAILLFFRNPQLFHRIKLNKFILLPFFLWISIALIGLLKGNLTQGLGELKTLIPFAFAPFFFLAFPKLKLPLIYTGFVVGVFISLTISSGYALWHYPLPDPRNASIFISHIRLSLFASFALYLLLQARFPRKSLAIIAFSFSLLSFLLLTATLSGWFFLFVTLLVHLYAKHRKFILLSSLLALGIISFISIRFYLTTSAHCSSGNTLTATANGNNYDYAAPSHQTENNHFVFQNICENEVKSAWLTRTGNTTEAKDTRNQTTYNTLIRYLTSKGLAKDSLGVFSLSNADIELIQQGYTNVNEPSRTPLDRRYHQLVYEFQVFLDNGNATGHSIFQRLHYYKAAALIIQQSFPLGVGIGNVKPAYKNAYIALNSNLDTDHQHAVHNQFLSYLILGGIIPFVLFGLYFWLGWKESSSMGLFEAAAVKVFLALAFASCLSEDTLTTQPGVAFFAVFTAIFFSRKN